MDEGDSGSPAAGSARDHDKLVEQVLAFVDHSTPQWLANLVDVSVDDILAILDDLHEANLVATEAGQPNIWRLRMPNPTCPKCRKTNKTGDLHCQACRTPLPVFSY